MPIEIESPEERGHVGIRLNLSESSVADATLNGLGLGELDLASLSLSYGDHRGLRGVREVLANDGLTLTPDDVLLTPGASGALFMVATALVSRNDHVVVVKPNYATNLETPRIIGARLDTVELTFEHGYRLDIDRLRELVTPKTRLVSITVPHNPTGVSITEPDLRTVIELVERNGGFVLVDETYRELSFGTPLPVAASLSPRAISVSSLSKAYGLPGVRVGWITSRNQPVMETLLAAKEQIVICGSVLDETVALRVLERKHVHAGRLRAAARRHFEIVRGWIEGHPLLEWVEPSGGVVCFPRFRAAAAVDVERFYQLLFDDHGCIVGPGHWFDEDRRSFRLGYGWPTTDELRDGLAAIDSAAHDALVR